MRLPLPIDSYRRTSPARLINCYAEAKPPDAKGPVGIVRAPGITRVATLESPGRGLALFDGSLFVVSGSTLYEVDPARSSVLARGLLSTAGRISAAATMDYLCILGRVPYLVDKARVLSQITDADFRPATSVEFMDNYLLFVEKESGRFFSSDFNDPRSYDPLNFATAEGQPDNLVGLIADHGQVLLAGTDSCELWSNVGGAGFPFARVSGGLVELGCAAPQSLAKLDNSIFWLASDLSVRRLSGLTPVRVSHHGVETALQGYGDVSNAYGLAFTFAGHLQYALTVPGFGTWVYDATTGRWHERKSYPESYWKVIDVVQFNGAIWALHEDGRLGVMQSKRYTEFGDTQRVEFVCDPLYKDGDPLIASEVALQVSTQ